MNDIDTLEQQLVALGSATRFPATPDLASGFWKQLGARPAARPAKPLLVGLALGAPALLVLALVVAVSPARDAAAGLVDRINIFQTDRSTEGLPTEITGRAVSLEQAETALGGPIPQPADPAFELERVLLQEFGGGSLVAVLFYSRDGGDFVLFASTASSAKGIPIGGDADVEPVAGLGKEGYWLQGQRIVQSVRDDGTVITESERVTDVNALVWDQEGRVYRIEGDMDKAEAIAIAQSLR